MITQQYAGADWIEAQTKKKLSDFGRTIADIVGNWKRGIYHLQGVDHQANWQAENEISLVYYGQLSQYSIVELLVLCERSKVHLIIKPHAFGYLRLYFRQCDGTELCISNDIETAKKMFGIE